MSVLPSLWLPVRVAASGGSGLLVNEELARTVRHESAEAIKHWWGVSTKAVWHWRRALGVGRAESEGTARLVRAAARSGGASMKARGVTSEERERRRRVAVEQNLGQHLTPGYHGPHWTRAQLRLLGRLPDEEVARRTGRTVNGVRVKRTRLGLANPADGRRRGATP